MNPKFYPLLNVFLDHVVNDVELTVAEFLFLMARRYNLGPEAASALLLEASETRWFQCSIHKGKICWKSGGLRTRSPVTAFRQIRDLMGDGVWRSVDTIVSEISYLRSRVQDVCDLYEIIGLFDSKVVWKDQTVYATIHGAVPKLYDPDFTVF